MIRARTLVLVALLAAPAAAQGRTVCVTGVVEPVGGPTICMQGETHRLAGTGVYLKSRLLDLNQFNGTRVRVEGHEIGLTCTVIDVLQVTLPLAGLDICGSPMLGCRIKLKVVPGALGRWALFAGFAPGFQPLGCTPPSFFIDGTVLLRPPVVTVDGGFFTGPSGDTVVPIPSSNALMGMQVWFQGARQDIGPIGPVQLTDVQWFTIAPLLPPCGSINC